VYLDNPDKIDCPQCGWDPINLEGLDPQCSICGGIGKINVYIVIQIHNVAVRWFDGTVIFDRTTAGRYETGDCRLTMKLEDALINPVNEGGDTYFHRARKVMVDNIECDVKTPPTRRGIGDLILCSVIVTRKS
jgi:hypothetical protein